MAWHEGTKRWYQRRFCFEDAFQVYLDEFVATTMSGHCYGMRILPDTDQRHWCFSIMQFMSTFTRSLQQWLYVATRLDADPIMCSMVEPVESERKSSWWRLWLLETSSSTKTSILELQDGGDRRTWCCRSLRASYITPYRVSCLLSINDRTHNRSFVSLWKFEKSIVESILYFMVR